MALRYVSLSLLLLSTTLLGGCLTTSEVKSYPGVEEARACQRALGQNREVVKGYVIHACTNTGVWLVDHVAEDGSMIAQYDFVNGDYAGPETGFGLVPVDSLGERTLQAYRSVRQSINHDLRESI